MYKIEKNVPLPTTVERSKGLTYTMRRMEVGDSILIEKGLSALAHSVAKKLGDRKIATRTVDGKCRVWRIA